MRESDIIERQGFGEARKDGGHNLYVRATLKCSVGDHIVQKDFTVDEWDHEKIDGKTYVCVDHEPDYVRVFGCGSKNADVRCSRCGRLVNMTMPKSKYPPENFVCRECQQ